MSAVKVVFKRDSDKTYHDAVAEEVGGANFSTWLLIYKMENGEKIKQIARHNVEDIVLWEEV
jgi:hypothetical protein